MSLQNNPSAESRDNIENQNISPKKIDQVISKLEKNFIDKYQISFQTFNKLKEFITQKESQNKLGDLKKFIQISNISESEKKSLYNISEEYFQLFVNEVFSQLESSKKQLSQLDTQIHGEHNEYIASSQNNGYISNARYIRACNPSKPHHHLDGCIAGITQSVVAIGAVTGELILDTIKTPYHIYQIASGKSKLPKYDI